MKTFRFALSVLIFSCICFSGYPEEEVALSLKEIDRLIGETEYNQALKGLTDYMKKNPDDFDRAQKRVEKILGARNKYNKNASNLIKLIKNGDSDVKQKLKNIAFLENSEENPTKNVSDFTNLARRTVSMGDVLVSYSRIMREGLALVRSEKYPEAAQKFEEGFDLKSELSDYVFEAGGPVDENDQGIPVVYEKDITDPVKQSVRKIREYIGAIKNLQQECEKAYRDYISSLNSKNFNNTVKAYERVETSFKNYSVLRNNVMAESRKLDECNALADKRNPLLLGTSYITFIQRFVRGDEGNVDTGVLGAMDAFWNTRVESMKAKTYELVAAGLITVQKEIPLETASGEAEKVAPQKVLLDRTKRFALLSGNIHSLYDFIEKTDGSILGSSLSGYPVKIRFVDNHLKNLSLAIGEIKNISDEEAGEIDASEVNRVSLEVIAQQIERSDRYEKIIARIEGYQKDADEAYNKSSGYFSDVRKKQEELNEFRVATEGELEESEINRRTTAGVDIDDFEAPLTEERNYLAALNALNIDRAGAHMKLMWGFISQAYYFDGKNSYDRFSLELLQAEKLLYGESVSTGQEGEIEAFVKKYPDRAKKEASRLREEISKKKKSLQDELVVLEGGKRYSGQNPDYDSGREMLEELIPEYDALLSKNQNVISQADIQIKLYEKAYEEGRSLYNRALTLFNKNDFDGANAAVEKASERLAEALDYEYTEEARKLREETLAELAGRILTAENEQVIRDVFALKEEATMQYYASDFDGAENTLVKAQTRWSKTNPDPDPEIEELLTVVKNVKGLAFGRNLIASDPHYPELSYSLDMAKLSFERGVTAKNSGNAAEAEKLFETALANVRNVQNVYPLNKEARLISLRLQQVTDPEGFPKQFEQQYKSAKANKALNERLADLQDLYEINPKYPGLKQEIYDLEEELGMHPKRVVKTDSKKKATSKLAEARKLFKNAGTNEAALNRALVAVNEAISMDSTNKDAKNLKLEIQLKMGSTATAILSQADEKLYAEAGRLFNQRKFEEANNVMNTLWNSAAARRSRKVIDLKNRIARRL